MLNYAENVNCSVFSSQIISVSVTSLTTLPVAVAGDALSRLKALRCERLLLIVDFRGMDANLGEGGGVARDGSLPDRCPLVLACHEVGLPVTDRAATAPPLVNTLDVLVGTGGGTLPTHAGLFLPDEVAVTHLPDHPTRCFTA